MENREGIMKVDLHIHTTASDGSWTPSRLIDEVGKAGIGLFAVTDHDTTQNIAETGRLAAAAGLAFLPGVEVSSTLGNQSFHILGYGIDPDNEELRRLIAWNTQLLAEADHNSIRKLIADGFAIDYGEYAAYQHDPARGGWKSLSFLIDKGFCRDVNDFFSRLFTAERGIRFPDFPPPAKAIQAIRSAGGSPVLAHPGSSFHGTSLDETLDFFGKEDIAGVECFHPSHDAATTRRVIAWCQRNGLSITGGSDCHGDFVSKRRLGRPSIHLEQVRLEELSALGV
ncbi:MAG TPA: PHP domain-containing protein [Methylomusa anaerophila]|uniref:PHP domain protein n=1 Tax=Methylomusa anaerophila TaxID=1930071 RepID=A0A348AK76_9FIRM|nr:PHP domain-containing protein [Methylomusa anaerophila]BBB91474.1 PHP domain protein [Methylomusa anaerophila]HML89937.1 PHP domain-containing protein [Methylomusa anaerophila]